MTSIMRSLISLFLLSFYTITLFASPTEPPKTTPDLELVKVIEGHIAPKSIVHSGNGQFFAQNMMYQHTITVYDRDFNLVKTISDQIELSDYKTDFPKKTYTGKHRGAPVEAAFSPDGSYAWVSNYKMYGKGFENPATDNCKRIDTFDQSFVYKINTKTLEIEQIIEVGCVPKYMAVTPNGDYLLVSNWCSGDLSIIDTHTSTEIKRIDIGRYPRGIVIDKRSQYAYIAVMGARKVARLNLKTFSLSYFEQVGLTPRHLCLAPSGRYLYITLSREGKIAKFDLFKQKVVAKVATGNAARSAVITPDGRFLYVVNYKDDTFSKIDLSTFKQTQTYSTHDKPIGITFDPETKSVWVACYSGSIMIFKDYSYQQNSQLAYKN